MHIVQSRCCHNHMFDMVVFMVGVVWLHWLKNSKKFYTRHILEIDSGIMTEARCRSTGTIHNTKLRWTRLEEKLVKLIV